MNDSVYGMTRRNRGSERGVIQMITRIEIADGIEAGIIRFVVDPNTGSGTVCQIGDNWFYFGGFTAEELNPEEYLQVTEKSELIDNVYETLNYFMEDVEYLRDEYRYYNFFLKENLNRVRKEDGTLVANGNILCDFKAREWQFIVDYIRDGTTYFHNESCRNRLVALWTTYCLHSNLDVDTAMYDATLTNLFNVLSDDQKDALGCYKFVKFYEMMAQWLA